MVFKLDITYDEVVDLFEIIYIDGSIVGYSLPTGICEISDINSMLKSLLPDEVKIDNTIDHIRLRSNLTIIRILSFTKKSFFNTLLGFTQARPHLLHRFNKKTPGSY